MTDDREEQPRVSVVVPCYNGEKFVGEAIECVLAQTFTDLELIVVNDGSTDGSSEQIRLHLRDPRVRCIEHEVNRGIAAARNTAIRASKGRYIAFLDVDDLWLPDKLDRQVAVFDEHDSAELGLVFTGRKVVLRNGRIRHRPDEVPSGINEMSRMEVLKALFLDNFIPMVSVLVRRKCFEEVGYFNESYRSGVDDYELFTRIVQQYGIYYLDRPLVVRREHGENWSDDLRLVPDGMRINRELVRKYPELGTLLGRREGAFLYKLGRAHQGQGNMKEARAAYRRAIRANPGYLKPRLGLFLTYFGALGTRALVSWNRLRDRLG